MTDIEPRTIITDGLILSTRERRQLVLEWATAKKTAAEIARYFCIRESQVSTILKQSKDEFLIDVEVKKRYLLSQLAEINAMRRKLWAIVEREHLLVSQGHVVAHKVGEDADGNPVWEDLYDVAPVLMAFDRLIKLQEREARLLGLDAAEKLDVSAYVTYAVEGVDMSTLR